MHPTIFLDTSVVCHLTDPPSSNAITRACQQLTQLWWHTRCVRSQTHVSEYVIQEIREGDPLRAARRFNEVQYLNQFPAGERVTAVSELLLLGGGLTAKARKASEQIACAAVNHCEILLTWNCRDIANAEKLPLLRMLMQGAEWGLPELATPFEIMENRYENL
jgi:predicted nucleic acid-binding protein